MRQELVSAASPLAVIELAAGDEAFYADIDDDQGYFFSDCLVINWKSALEKIVIKQGRRLKQRLKKMGRRLGLIDRSSRSLIY